MPLLVSCKHVSTHAPAWGATRTPTRSSFCRRVSTHAPAWGATYHIIIISIYVIVSTHAPAWGATAASSSAPSLLLFQPTRPHGARPWVYKLHFRPDSFNPRARMGRDLSAAGWMISSRPFQPTRPHGARHQTVFVSSDVSKFQPTRPHGARR